MARATTTNTANASVAPHCCGRSRRRRGDPLSHGNERRADGCDHEGQCVLLAVWATVGEHMRRLLEERTLADIAEIARGEAPWPEPV